MTSNNPCRPASRNPRRGRRAPPAGQRAEGPRPAADKGAARGGGHPAKVRGGAAVASEPFASAPRRADLAAPERAQTARRQAGPRRAARRLGRHPGLLSAGHHGRLAAVGSHLAKLPKDAGPLVYSHLLTLLVKGKQSIVLPDELLALADASPGEPNDEQLALLGQLLAQSRKSWGHRRRCSPI